MDEKKQESFGSGFFGRGAFGERERMGLDDERLQEALGHLRLAAKEALAAAQTLVDVAFDSATGNKPHKPEGEQRP